LYRFFFIFPYFGWFHLPLSDCPPPHCFCAWGDPLPLLCFSLPVEYPWVPAAISPSKPQPWSDAFSSSNCYGALLFLFLAVSPQAQLPTELPKYSASPFFPLRTQRSIPLGQNTFFPVRGPFFCLLGPPSASPEFRVPRSVGPFRRLSFSSRFLFQVLF